MSHGACSLPSLPSLPSAHIDISPVKGSIPLALVAVCQLEQIAEVERMRGG